MVQPLCVNHVARLHVRPSASTLLCAPDLRTRCVLLLYECALCSINPLLCSRRELCPMQSACRLAGTARQGLYVRLICTLYGGSAQCALHVPLLSCATLFARSGSLYPSVCTLDFSTCTPPRRARVRYTPPCALLPRAPLYVQRALCSLGRTCCAWNRIGGVSEPNLRGGLDFLFVRMEWKVAPVPRCAELSAAGMEGCSCACAHGMEGCSGASVRGVECRSRAWDRLCAWS